MRGFFGTARRAGFGVAAAVAAALVTASPAAADPAGPTNYQSVVRAVTPTIDGLAVEVIGGDSFVRLRVSEAIEVVVLGYEGEPYLRFTDDGTVRENARSPAVVLNQTRYGTTYDERADAEAPPEWGVVANDGEHVWHDHRVHWMTRSTPPQLAGRSAGKVLDWTIPLLVDGNPVQIEGELFRTKPPTLLPSLALGLVVAVVAAIAMRRWTVGGAVLLAVALAATIASAVDQLSIPAAAGRRSSLIIIPALAAACAIVSIARRRSHYSFALEAAAALILPMWVLLNAKALTRAHLPGDFSPSAMRITLVAAAGAVLAFVAIEAPRQLRAAAQRNAARARAADEGDDA
jgi:hypothetical protein